MTDNNRKTINTDNQKLDRRRAGFSMGELLIVIAIIGILGALAVVGVINYQRSLRQLEYDGIAKEIFVAAQNHLTNANSQGLLESAEQNARLGTDEKTAKTVAAAVAASTLSLAEAADDNDEEDTNEKGIYYYVVPDGDVDVDDLSSALGMMLPFASIDETVRSGGSYIIRYKYLKNSNNAASVAVVKDVFYSSREGTQYGHTFSLADCTTLIPALCGDGKKQERRDYDGAVLGYYGGADASLGDAITLKTPTLMVHNEEKLYVEITNPNAGIATAMLKLMVEGQKSGAKAEFDLVKDNVLNTFPDIIEGTRENPIVVLDDVTTSAAHFSKIFSTSGPNVINLSGAFIPGENLKIYAVADATVLANIAQSKTETTNSLFAGAVSRDDKNVAQIKNIRHLENLDADISGLNTGEANFITSAEQNTNFSWKTFQNNILHTINPKLNIVESDLKIIPQKEGRAESLPGCYLPVQLEQVTSYDGRGHSISDVIVNINDKAGLFSDLPSDKAVRNLELIDFYIISTRADAGALAGTAHGATISGVLVRNLTDNGNSEINGEGHVGGLIGQAMPSSDGTKNCTIENCAAAVYVRSTGSADASAGGLIGSDKGSVISNCYSGGHTDGGNYTKYNDFFKNAETGQLAPIRTNVVAENGSAGGLIGAAVSSTINNTYSTCSAYGSSTGGLIGTTGEPSGCSISNSYATGLVEMPENGKAGALIGTASNTTYHNCAYLDIINYEAEIKAVGSLESDPAGIKQIDADIINYEEYAAPDPLNKLAVVYDKILGIEYQGKYQFKTIAVLAGLGTDSAEATERVPRAIQITHYGDWPVPEIFIINTKN